MRHYQYNGWPLTDRAKPRASGFARHAGPVFVIAAVLLVVLLLI